MSKTNKTFAESKIESIQSGSSTNLSGGLLQGLCTILDRGEPKNDVASVLLFTDGLANQGNFSISLSCQMTCLMRDNTSSKIAATRNKI